MTVLFADLVNSTALGERLDPEALRIIQTRFFDTMRATIERHEGSVEKFIGDEVMSVFGLPRLHEDDALRAVRAAADMQQALDALNRDLDTRRGVRLAIRTGINSGTVVAGDANSGRALVTGDVVVTAKRLETAAQPGEILIGAETYRLVGHAVDSEPLPPITAKGKAEPLRAWRVAAVDPAAGAIPRHLHSPFVGRDRQLRVLIDVAERSRAERTVLVVSLLGPAGVGKTRLAQEFTTRLGTGASVIRGHCLPYGEGISYWPLAEALRTAAGITPDEDPETARGHLAALAIDLPRADVVIDRISAAIGVAPTTGSSGIDAQETYWAFRRLLEGMARQRPLLAIFDDVQWATPTFLDLLEHLGDWSREAPILLLVIARSELLEVRPSWGAGKPSAAVLFLEPLDEAAVSEMLSNLTGHQLPESLAREIEQTAEGNPFFVEELVANLLDDGGLASRSDGYRLTSRPHRVAIPPTIELLLASRLDALPDRERTLLGSAAVVGRRFGAAEVAELSDPADRRLILPALMALVRKDLLQPDAEATAGVDGAGSDVRFQFRHQLVRDAAYEALAKQERARLHEVLANWMESTLGDRFAALRDTVGYHLEQAAIFRREIAGEDESVTRLAQRAADHLEAAARHADAIGDRAVIHLLERANRLRAPDDPRRLSTLPLLARYLFLATRVDEAKAALDEVLASSRADPSTRAAALELNLGLSLGNSAAELRPGVEEALSIRRAVGEPAGIARALLALAELESFAGRYRHARELIDDALASAQKAGDVGLEAQLRRFRTAALFMSLPPRPEDRRSMLEEDLAFARKHGLLSMEAATLRSLGMARGLAGSRSQAKELIEQARAIHRDLGHEFWARMFFGDVLLDYWAGDKQLAADQWRALSHELAVVGEKAQLSEVAVELALCLLDLDETKEAEEALRTAEATGAPDNVITQVQLKAARARLLARHGDLPGAELMAREAVKDAEVAEVYFLAPRAHLALGDVLRLADRLGEAVTEWRQAIAIQDAFGNQLYADQLRRELTEIEEAGGTG